MSRYQAIELIDVDKDVVTLQVTEVHHDMWTISDMLKHMKPGQLVEVDREKIDSVDWSTYQIINAAALFLFGHYMVARQVKALGVDELAPEHFVRAVEIVSATQVVLSNTSGRPLYEAVVRIHMQREDQAELFSPYKARGWDGYAFVDGSFSDSFF